MTEAVATFVAGLINDPTFQTFTETQVETRLRERVIDVRYMALAALPSYAPGGGSSYKVFTSPKGVQYWNNDFQLTDGQYNVINASLVKSDQLNGRFEFGTDQGTIVYIVGESFDPYGTAADILTEFAAQYQMDPTSHTAYNSTFTFTEGKRKGPLDMAMNYRRLQRYEGVNLTRSDVNIF